MGLRRMRFIVIISVLFVLTTITNAQDLDTRFKVVGYYSSYNIYDREYFVTDIPVENLTHLIYAPIAISDNGQCESSDDWADMGYKYPGDRDTERLRGNFKQLAILKEDYPDLRVIMGIGGWDFSEYFSEIAASEQARVRFARSCLAFMREYGFDGIDIDWRFPVEGGKAGPGIEDDTDNFAIMLADFRGQIDYWNTEDDEEYVLTLTIPGVPEQYQFFPLEDATTLIDWFNVMSFSYEGAWSEFAGHAAPLFSSDRDPRDVDSRATYNVDGTVNGLLNLGIPADKIVIGIPFFGQSWRNVRPNDYFGLYSETDGVPTGTRPGGQLFFSDLTTFLDSDRYVRFFDQSAGVPWMYNEEARIAISYENAESILGKAAYVRRVGLGGMLAWELSFDDRSNTLISAMAEGLRER